MTEFYKNGFIDLKTSNPVGDYPQQVSITGHNIEGTLTVTFNAQNNARIMTFTDKQGNKQAIPYNYQLINGRHVFSTTSSGANPQTIHVSFGAQDITVDAQNFPDDRQRFGDHQLSFRQDGSYTVRSGIASDGRARSVSEVAPDGSYVTQVAEENRAKGAQRGTDYSFYGGASGGQPRIVIINSDDMQDKEEAMRARGGTFRGFAEYERDNPHNFNAGIKRYDGSAVTAYFNSRRDESLQTYSANLNGEMGEVKLNCLSPESTFNDESFFLKSSASFTNYATKDTRSIDLAAAMQLRRETFAQLGLQDTAESEMGGLSCSVPRHIETAIDLKDEKADRGRR